MPYTHAHAPLEAVLWDMDGTIVDTEPYWIAAELEMAAESGGSWNEELAADLVGMPLENSALALQQRAGVAGSVDDIVDGLMSRVIDQIKAKGLPWRPGARELLAQLREANVPCALVTMSWKPVTNEVLAGIVPGTFEAVITGDEVEHGKPHPEAYLRAADALGVEISNCLAIEDSVPGLAAATASGAWVLGVEAKVPVPPAPGLNRLASLTQIEVSDLFEMVSGREYDLLATA